MCIQLTFCLSLNKKSVILSPTLSSLFKSWSLFVPWFCRLHFILRVSSRFDSFFLLEFHCDFSCVLRVYLRDDSKKRRQRRNITFSRHELLHGFVWENKAEKIWLWIKFALFSLVTSHDLHLWLEILWTPQNASISSAINLFVFSSRVSFLLEKCPPFVSPLTSSISFNVMTSRSVQIISRTSKLVLSETLLAKKKKVQERQIRRQ